MEAQSLRGTDARVVVGVDLGTTFSGFAYAHVDSADAVHKFYEWEGALEASAAAYCKTQTSLYYDSDLNLREWGWPALVSFNHDCKKQGRRGKQKDSSPPGHFVTKFKLHLAGAGNVGSSADGLSADPLPRGLTVDTAITDYLTGLAQFIIKQLQTKYGPQLSAQQIQWCLTVPAIWDDIAKQKMKVYAQKAGMVQGRYTPRGVEASPHELMICLEPEAASLYCLDKCKDIQVGKGDRYLIADIGGGTVDIVVHEKASNDGVSGGEVKVKEVVASYGGLCGGTYVDKNFDAFLNQTVGCFQAYVDQNPSNLRLQIQKTWEEGKRSYNGKLKSSFTFSFPAGLEAAWEEYEEDEGMEPRDSYDELEVTNKDMKQIFDPVVDEILGLIAKEINPRIKAIMVVGGFSASPYLMDRVKEAFSGKVQTINPPEPGGAICHGAVLMGLAPVNGGVVSRIARKTYGIATTRLFRDGDPPDKKFLVDGENYCRDLFSIFVEKGTELQVDHRVTKNYTPAYTAQRSIDFKIHSSSYLKRPAFTTDKGVVREDNFYMDISDGLHLDSQRRIEVSMFFGTSAIKVQGRRRNFGDTGKIENFWVEL